MFPPRKMNLQSPEKVYLKTTGNELLWASGKVCPEKVYLKQTGNESLCTSGKVF